MPEPATALPPAGGRPAALLLALVASGLLAGLLAAYLQWRANQGRIQQAIDRAGAELVEDLAARLASYEYGLRGARGAIVSVGIDHIRREDFARYSATRDLPREFPGAHGFGFIRRVPPGQLAAATQRAQADGWPGFTVRELEPHAGPHYVIEYIEPVARNLQAVGLDIASEPLRRAAADQAMRTGQATITEPITLVQAEALPSRGFLVLLPVYRQPLDNQTEAARVAALAGWAYAPLVIDEVLGGLMRPRPGLTLVLRDAEQAADVPPFYASGGTTAAPVDTAQPMHRQQLPVFGRQWLMQVHADEAYLRQLELNSPAGTGTTLALAVWLLAAAMHQRRRAAQREQLATAAQGRLAVLAENSSDAIISESLDGRVTDWNRAAEQIFGWTAAEAVGQPLFELIGSPDSVAETAEILRRAGQGETLLPFDTVRRRRDGTLVDVSVAASPITDHRGRVVGVGKSLRDISARRTLERQLKAFAATLERLVAERTSELESARRQMQTILDALPSMVGHWDARLVNRFANRAHHDWLGLPPGQLPGREMAQVIGADALAQLMPAIRSALQGQARAIEHTLATPGGQRHVITHCLPEVVAGQVQGLYLLAHDVTELNDSRRRLADSEAFLERAGRLAGIGGWQLDLDTRRLSWTAQTRRIHEVPDDHQPTLQSAMALLGPTARAALQRLIDDALRDGKPWDVELPMHTATGRSIWVRTVGEAEFSAEAPRRPRRLIGAIQDITHRREADRALRRLSAAEAANAAKTTFVTHVSHEMRTPLNAVIGFTHVLQQGRLDADQRHVVSRLRLAADALLAMVNDVLDLSKIEAGQMRLEQEPFSPAGLVAEVQSLIQPLVDARAAGDALPGDGAEAQGRALHFEVQCAPDLPEALLGDALRLRQVLINLLGNAVKFTERGRIVLAVDVASRTAQEVRLRLVVSDTGIGLSPAQQARLYQPFAQAELSTTRRHGGSGLGLSIVRRLLDLMQGQITLQSAPGQGSRFEVTVPLSLAPAGALSLPVRPQAAAPQQQPLRGVRVLVVDDSPLNLEVAQRLLQLAGAQVEVAADGQAAIERLRRAPDAADVVLLDVQMPGLDGLTVARRIRAEPALDALPLVGLSAGAMPADQLLALRAGMDDFVTKPVPPGVLVDVLRRALARQGRLPVAAEGTAPPAAAEGGGVIDPNSQLVADQAGDRDALADAPSDHSVGEVASPGPAAIGNQADQAITGVRETWVTPGPTRGWPVLEGVDLTVFRQNLGDDPVLLGRLLQRLLAESATTAAVPLPPPADAAGRQALARGLHKLRGSAGILGAWRLQQAANEADQALQQRLAIGASPVAGPVDRADSVADASPPDASASRAQAQAILQATSQAEHALARAHGLLREAWDSLSAQQTRWAALSGGQADGASVAAGQGTGGLAGTAGETMPMAAFTQALQANDLAVLTAWRADAAAWRHRLGVARWQAVDAAIESLDFEQALACLGQPPGQDTARDRVRGAVDAV